MSDCQSSFGSARSKRRSGWPLASARGAASAKSPSSCRIRRTSVSETPSAANRASTSRIRRVPYPGCSRRSSVTASRRTSAPQLSRTRLVARFPSSSPAAPSLRNRLTHSDTVVIDSPSSRATSVCRAPRSTTSRTTRRRSSVGCGRRLPPPLSSTTPAPPPPAGFFFRLISVSPFGLSLSARTRGRC